MRVQTFPNSVVRARLNNVGWCGLTPASDRYLPYLHIVLRWPSNLSWLPQEHLQTKHHCNLLIRDTTLLAIVFAQTCNKKTVLFPHSRMMETVKPGGGVQDNMDTILVRRMPDSDTRCFRKEANVTRLYRLQRQFQSFWASLLFKVPTDRQYTFFLDLKEQTTWQSYWTNRTKSLWCQVTVKSMHRIPVRMQPPK